MITFSVPLALAYIILSSIFPGILLFLGLLKDKPFSFIEKIFIGASFSLLFYFLPFFEYLFFGIKFSYFLVIINTFIVYAVSLFFFLKNKAYEIDFSFDINKSWQSIAILFLSLLTFWIRLQSLTPIYEELDPYYYIYIAQQIITLGYNPFDDKTAWYPELKVDHRQTPLLAYMEATWYKLYSPYSFSNYTLSLISNLYPPLVSMFAVFLVYFIIRQWYKKEFGLISAAVFSFLPMYILKTMAGEAEAQPFAFFAISLFLAFYLLSYKYKDKLYAFLAGFSYLALSLGSSSEIVGAATLIISGILISLFNFIEKKEFESNYIIVCLFAIFTGIIKSVYVGHLSITYSLGVLLSLLFYLGLNFLRNYDFKLSPLYVAGAFFSVFLLLLTFTPLGLIVKKIALAGLRIGEYYNVLAKTIAEQGSTGSVMSGQLGFIGSKLPFIFLPFSLLFDILFKTLFLFLNNMFDLRLSYLSKEPSLVFVLLFISMFCFIYSFNRNKKQKTPALILISIGIPPILIGLLKAKYIIYLGYVLSLFLGFILGELLLFLCSLGKWEEKKLFNVLFFVGLVIAIFQFYSSPSIPILKSSLLPRFQDAPELFKDKFTAFCYELNASGDTSISKVVCKAAEDPVEYANKGVNEQYDKTLCLLSFMENLQDMSMLEGAYYRCSRVAPYWIKAMLWLKDNTPKNARITSWWDYGHWENFFAQRNAVIRNEHKSLDMILTIAYDFLQANSSKLRKDMLYYNSSYVLFDKEILFSGHYFGGKYGALNYLSCAKSNGTDISLSPGESFCEFEHQWEQVLVPTNITPSEVCEIDYDKKGIIVYEVVGVREGKYVKVRLEPSYCLGTATLVNGQNITALYDMDRRNEDGSLALHKALLQPVGRSQGYFMYNLIYTKDPIWLVNGTATSGWPDHKSKFYDSNLYKGFVLKDLDGFELVYDTDDIKIYKIKEK